MESSLRMTARWRFSEACEMSRIFAVRPEVNNSVPQPFEVFHQFLLQLESCMVRGNRDSHSPLPCAD